MNEEKKKDAINAAVNATRNRLGQEAAISA
jgi:hypothetical protein